MDLNRHIPHPSAHYHIKPLQNHGITLFERVRHIIHIFDPVHTIELTTLEGISQPRHPLARLILLGFRERRNSVK